MALNIYKLNEATGAQDTISAGTFLLPISMGTAPGGSAAVTKVYLQNADVTKWYTNIALTPTTIGGDPIVSTNVTVKMLSGLNRPSEDEWTAALSNSNSLIESPVGGGDPRTYFPDIGVLTLADTDFYPFWVRVEVAKSAPIGDSQFSLQLVSTEQVVVP
jgi:hypothetical protein